MYSCHTEQEIHLRKEVARDAASSASDRTKKSRIHRRKETRQIANGENHYIGVSVDRN